MPTPATTVHPGSFEDHRHWYEKAYNATIHPMIHFFMNLKPERIINRYCHLHPVVNRDALQDILNYEPKYYRWSGADLINVTTAGAKKQMVVIENNSCPSGQKSMPLLDESEEQGGYRQLIEHSFKPYANKPRGRINGGLACITDKNKMECTGYAAVMADVFDEPVHYVNFYDDDNDPGVRFEDGIMHVFTENDGWVPIRAAFRYVTQRPWSRIPMHCKTRIFNPVVVCLAGGRNKMIASKAYDMYNTEVGPYGLKINTPETIWDVSKNEIPLWVRKMGGQAVVKVPYSNAGQGVFTIVSESELEALMEIDFPYDQFIVQSLIGNYAWSSTSSRGRLYHVGTIPNQKGKTFVFDIRMMIQSTKEGFRPVSVYSRRAEKALVDQLAAGASSWDILGTNLSIKQGDNQWGSDTSRLMLMDRRDFNKLGIGLDDLIEAYIQTVLSTVSIDKMAQTLYNTKGRFRTKLFRSLNNDQSLINEILMD